MQRALSLGSFILLQLIASTFPASNAAVQMIPVMRNNSVAQSAFDVARNKARESNSSLLPLYGSFKIAEYYFEIQIGTPGQTFYVQVDTGSSSTAIPMVECKEGPQSEPCHAVKQPYDPTKSSTATVVPCNSECSFCYSRICGFRLQYGDGSKVEGPVFMDKVSFGPFKFGMTFGGVKTSSAGFERGPVDGISGFASFALSPSDMDPFFDALIRGNPMDKIFSICLGWEGGFITFGGHDPRFNEEDISYVPMAFSNFYSIKILGLSVNDLQLPLSPNDFNMYSDPPVVDSGTTLTIFPAKVFNEIKKYLQANYCDIIGICPDDDGKTMFDGYFYRIPSSQISKFPTFTFKLENQVELKLGPEYYMSEIDGYTGLGISVGKGVPTILGNTFMRAFNTIFDTKNQRVGFVQSNNCHGVPYIISSHSGDMQTGTISMRLRNPLKVKVVDAVTKKPAVGVPVHFAVDFPRELGHFSQQTVSTDEFGIASTYFYFGRAVGHYYISASVKNAAHSPVTFIVDAGTMIDFYLVAGFIFFVVLSISAYTFYAWWIRRKRTEAERNRLTQLMRYDYEGDDEESTLI